MMWAIVDKQWNCNLVIESYYHSENYKLKQIEIKAVTFHAFVFSLNFWEKKKSLPHLVQLIHIWYFVFQAQMSVHF